jgi:hypothetical protein
MPTSKFLVQVISPSSAVLPRLGNSPLSPRRHVRHARSHDLHLRPAECPCAGPRRTPDQQRTSQHQRKIQGCPPHAPPPLTRRRQTERVPKKEVCVQVTVHIYPWISPYVRTLGVAVAVDVATVQRETDWVSRCDVTPQRTERSD